MNKEEILQRAREENKGIDEVKCAVENEAAKMSIAASLLLCYNIPSWWTIEGTENGLLVFAFR